MFGVDCGEPGLHSGYIDKATCWLMLGSIPTMGRSPVWLLGLHILLFSAYWRYLYIIHLIVLLYINVNTSYI